jgi:hypothetical protein
MQQRHKEPSPKKAASSRKQEGIQQDNQADSWTGGHKASSRVFHQTAENECLHMVQDSAPIQTEETARGLHADATGALAPPGYFLPISGSNGDTLIGY